MRLLTIRVPSPSASSSESRQILLSLQTELSILPVALAIAWYDWVPKAILFPRRAGVALPAWVRNQAWLLGLLCTNRRGFCLRVNGAFCLTNTTESFPNQTTLLHFLATFALIQ